jgi:probable F420-dependent oxidoreductase
MMAPQARVGHNPTMRPFQFLAAANEVVDGRGLADRARRAEATGYHGLIVPDHLIDQLAPVPALATIAAATERLRIMTFVLNNDLRHPAGLAQDLATLDVLSGGRLDVGIGAGWNQPEYAAIGLAFEPVAVRVERLTEAIAVLKGAFGDDPFSFRGRHYTITDLDGRPKPVQRPHPPLLIGGGGRQTLELAAREADIVGLAPRVRPDGRGDPRSITMEATAEKIGWVREAAGERFDRLVLNAYPSMVPIRVTDDVHAAAREALASIRARTGRELTEAELLESPHVFIGSVDGLAEKLLGLRERFGITSFLTGEIGELAPVVERLSGT